jgi:hypothetical protein
VILDIYISPYMRLVLTSSGSQTAAGEAKSFQNAFKHGFHSQPLFPNVYKRQSLTCKPFFKQP